MNIDDLFDSLKTTPPVSFIYGGETSEKLLPEWKCEITENESCKPDSSQRSICYTDPSTKLKVSCDVTSFSDFPALELVVRFKNEDWENTEVSKFLRISSYFGLILGVVMIWSAVIGMLNHIPPSWQYRDNTENNFDLLTSISLIIVGCVCFMKPINDLPWAGIIGIFAGITLYSIYQNRIINQS